MPDHVDQMIQFAGCVAAYFGDPTNPAGQAELSLWLARVLGRSTVHWRLEMDKARAYLNPWRDISTAPRDGTRVLMGTEHWVAEGCFVVHLGEWFGIDGARWRPSHWTPLPLPPAPAA